MKQKTTVKAGTTLFHVALRYLGDATQWTRIAQINDMEDPFVNQVMTLNIPAVRAGQDQGIGGET